MSDSTLDKDFSFLSFSILSSSFFLLFLSSFSLLFLFFLSFFFLRFLFVLYYKNLQFFPKFFFSYYKPFFIINKCVSLFCKLFYFSYIFFMFSLFFLSLSHGSLNLDMELEEYPSLLNSWLGCERV